MTRVQFLLKKENKTFTEFFDSVIANQGKVYGYKNGKKIKIADTFTDSYEPQLRSVIINEVEISLECLELMGIDEEKYGKWASWIEYQPL